MALTLVLTPNWPGGAMRLQATGSQTQAAPSDGGWPRLYKLASGDSALFYQPQIESWDNQKHMVAWSAISYQAQGAEQPALGTIKIEADTDVAVNERLVNFSAFRITEFDFPTLSRDQSRKVVTELEQAVPATERVISLDRVLAGIDKSQIRPGAKDAAGIKADPPKIFHSTKPAVLMIFDGQPVWSPVKDVDLKYAVNTNWDIFEEPSTKTFYLRDDKYWLKSTNLNGPWAPAGKLPPGFSKLPADDNWKDVRANLPGKSISASAVPTVFESFEPAELILIKGESKYVPVKGTSLLWVSNTESDLFRMGSDGAYYFLVAGRWFSAPNLGGPWTFATPSLPADFRSIPVDHPRSRVLASVPGTDQAIEAVLLASIPQTARVNRKELKAPEVVYQGGTPEFKPIEATTLERAVNTDKDIIKVGDLYYMCFQGVWFMARSATGPWEVASSVPKDIYTIPASSPAYHVTYVVEEKDDDDSDDWVKFAALAGYTGMMIAWGCTVWGSGWYYPPYVWYGGVYPAYFWHPATYGAAAWYNPYTGTYGRGVRAYGPYGGAGAWGAYNPRTGTYARGGAVYGPYGSRGFAQAYNPRTGAYGATRQAGNIYGNWGSSYVQRGDNWAQTAHVTNYATGRRTTAARGSEGGAAVHTRGPAGGSVARSGGGDIYAGRDGNVYRKQDGSWQKYGDGGWSQVQKPQVSGQTRQGLAQTGQVGQTSGRAGISTADQLNRDWSARTEGAQRVRDNQAYRLGGGGRQSGGSFRSGGGGFRGGGFRRR
jgi:hypothetical protein